MMIHEVDKGLPFDLDPDNLETIQGRFEKFHRDNPHVYVMLEKGVYFLIQRGRKRLSIHAVIEALRWDMDFDTTDEVFKLNAENTSRYARLLLENHPEWRGRWELRRLRSP
jgi:hypothetical protein